MKYTKFFLIIFSLFAFSSCSKELICTISSPADNAIYSEEDPITVTVEAKPAQGSIINVQLYIDESPIQFLTTAPYNFTIQKGSISVGKHSLKVIAQDSKGNLGSATKTITVKEKEIEIKIGNNYQGGIIAYIDETGKHGLIAAPHDQSTGIAWSKYSTMPYFSGAKGTAIGTGKLNTAQIIQYLGGGQYAAILCDALILNGYDDWFLPSRDELAELCKNKELIGGFANQMYASDYWSSSDYGETFTIAWAYDFWLGKQTTKGKTSEARVRAVREF